MKSSTAQRTESEDVAQKSYKCLSDDCFGYEEQGYFSASAAPPCLCRDWIASIQPYEVPPLLVFMVNKKEQ